jgi:tripartite-type tricarboxylate transporter receptor subunit TctC
MATVCVFALGKKETQNDGTWKWERKVTIVVPWGPGGGADPTARQLQVPLQRALGVPVEIVNVEGGGGIAGTQFASRQPADGYTYVLGTQSMILLDIQGTLPVKWREEFVPVAKLVHSTNALISSKKAMGGKYTDFKSFITYAKAHPGELTCGMLSATATDAVSTVQTLSAGLQVPMADVNKYIKIVSYGSGSELTAALVGGHLNIGIAGLGDIEGLVESGDIVPLIAMSEKRLPSSPNVPCTGEMGIAAYVGTWRGIYARTATPKAAVDSFAVALKKAWDSPEYQKFMDDNDYLERLPGYEDAAGTNKLTDSEYIMFTEYLKAMGLVK